MVSQKQEQNTYKEKNASYNHRCKSLFEVGEAILGEGGYFLIFWGAYAIFSPS